eukprot:7287061-Pyramimonas_sp.AAC.1
MGMRDYLLTTFISQVVKDDNIKATFRSNLWDHATYRVKVSNYENEVEPNLSWKNGWPHSVELTLQLCEQIIYGTEYDAALKAGLTWRKGPSEIMTYVQI